jgi:hypothetical protein
MSVIVIEFLVLISYFLVLISYTVQSALSVVALDETPLAFAYWTCLVCSCAFNFFDPKERVKALRDAVRILRTAIREYEQSSDLAETMLNEADRRSWMVAHMGRIRQAPAWIRRQMQVYRLSGAVWIAPAALMLALPLFMGPFGPGAVRTWKVLLVVLAIPALIAAVAVTYLRTRLVAEASKVLSSAVERYEFDSTANDDDLTEARRSAFEMLAGKRTNVEV